MLSLNSLKYNLLLNCVVFEKMLRILCYLLFKEKTHTQPLLKNIPSNNYIVL